MPEKPLVSAVIPTCNRRQTLSRCLEALAAQTYRAYEIIVVDDCSSDDTSHYLEQFAASHPDTSFRWLRNESRAGANPSRNRGLRESRGDFVAFADDDCIAQPQWLERLMAGFVSDRVAAVTGRIVDPEPSNIYELTFKGTHRVHGGVHATRLVAGNMCIRRHLLLKYHLDEDRAAPEPDISVSGRGDEEGLFLMLRAAGWEQRVAPDAVVLHDHHYSRRTFFRQAYRSGASAARLGYKYHLPLRIELMPLMLAYLLLPLVWLGSGWWCPTASYAALFLAAVLYNEFFRKRKTILETLITFPVLLVYYHMRLAGYLVQYVRLLAGKDRLRRVRLSRTPSSPQPPGTDATPKAIHDDE